jgi:hypothetical protein
MSLPIVLCGRLERVGSLVIKELEPEYEGMLLMILELASSFLYLT